MTDAGLRVTEVVHLQVRHFNIPERTVTVCSLKKRAHSREKRRTIPLTQRVIEAFADYWPRLCDHSPEAFLFPASSQSKQLHLNRKVVWRRLKEYSDGLIHPHMLRHYFGTRIVNEGNDIRTAQKLLYTIELVERLAKEPLITVETTQSIKHAASKKEIDFTVPLLLAFSSLIVLRYVGNEVGDDPGAFRIIGGAALILALFARPLFRSLKRRYL